MNGQSATTSATTSTKTQNVADERSTDAAREGWNGKQIRTLLYWAATFVVVFELAAGSLWNLFAIDWVEAQLHHLG